MSNLSKIKRQEMLDYISQLKAIHNDDESIIALNNIENALTEKKYGLVWEEHSENVDEMLEHHIPVFEEVEDKKIEVKPDKEFNFLLEGDNLHSLKLLEKTHKGKIDVIYIDPPYNTGAKNWKYNNNYVDKNDTFKHSKFISFLHKRLIIARRLLADTGIIVVTIDDYELENLLMLMNEIFGEDKHLGTVVIKNNPQGRSSTSGFQVSHEYALFYGMKNSVIGRLERTEEQLGRYKEKDEIGPFEWRNFRAQYSQESPSMVYPIFIKKDGSDFRIPQLKWNPDRDAYDCLEEPSSYEFISMPIDNTGRMRTWKWSKETLLRDKEKHTGIRKDTNGNYAVYYKGRLKNPDILPFTLWDKPEYSASTFGANILSSIIGKGKFNYPKSLYAVIDCIQVASANNPQALILDFFSGSGTTGHAVMEMNKLDGGSRKFILCTNNESNICRKVTYPRLQSVIKGYEYEGVKKDILMTIKLSISNLKKMDNIFEKIEKLKREYQNEYEKFSLQSENGELKLIGFKRKNDLVRGIPHNLKYFKTDFINKLNEDKDILSDRLLSHIKEMVELENMCEIDGVNRVLILTEDDLAKWLTSEIKPGASLYLPSYILLSREEENLCQEKNVTLIDVPDYYFLYELREAREL